MTRWIVSAIATTFGFVSGVVRNARTFHPDGRTFQGTVNSETAEPALARAGGMLEGRVLMRIGMGVVKRHAPAWLTNKIPDAPSIAVRFSPSSNADAISVQGREKDELDILFTAGGDRLWKLICNLATGGHCFGLNQFDYFRNRYFADVPYRISSCGLDVWLRLSPLSRGEVDTGKPNNAETREQALTEAAARGAVFVIEAQPTADPGASFASFARIRFDREVKEIDQEALHFQPTAGRGYEPYGVLSSLREKIYPTSAHARPPNRAEREVRDRKGFLFRLFHPNQGSTTNTTNSHPLTLKKLASVFGLLVFVVIVVAAGYGAWRFLPNYPLTNPPDVPGANYSQREIDEQRFKYGSTGGEANLGFPLLIWQAAPLVCAETLKSVVGNQIAADYVTRVRNYTPRPDGGPDQSRQDFSREGFKAFGIIYEREGRDGREKDIPVGVSKRRHLGFDRVFVNCAFCHSSTVRVSADGKPNLVLGMPANLLDIRNFEDFLFQCAGGPQFSKENLLPEIENMTGRLSLLDRYVLYPLAIWIIRDRVQFLSSRLGFFVKQPPWGPGRVDTFSNAKGIFNWPWQRLPDWRKGKPLEPDQVGTVEFPSIWRQGARKKRADGCPMELHWDGNNDAVEERDLSAAFGTGALPTNIDHKNLEKIEEWLVERSVPPKFTDFFPEAFNAPLAENGKKIYARLCAKCHGASGTDFSGELVGRVMPIEKIGTDRYRLDNYTEGLATIQAMLYAGEKKSGPAPAPQGIPAECDPSIHGGAQENSYRFKRFRKTYGYANTPLDGIWLRAPYLHNGSVPTLWDLLHPADKRPSSYFRGNDEYDPSAMGFRSDRPGRPDGRAYFLYDTSEPGNSNAGHEGEIYGTTLSEEDRRALIEYLKTF